MINVAAFQYKIESYLNWGAYTSKTVKLIVEAKEKGAQLVALPEYAGIEIVEKAVTTDLALYQQIQTLLPKYIELYQHLANKHQIYIQPGSILVKNDNDKYHNRAYFFGPQGAYGFQDKLNLVSDEHNKGLLERGIKQTIFETAFGLIGIAICYDCEFPELIRNFTKAGVRLILVPSYTPSQHSFKRVYYSCKARALENQCFVVMSSAVGHVSFGEDLENLVGQANIFTPIDVGFNSDGILSQGPMNESYALIEKLSFRKIDQVRKHGQVKNYNDFMKLNHVSNLTTIQI